MAGPCVYDVRTVQLDGAEPRHRAPEIYLFELDLEALGTGRREDGPLPL